MNRSHTIKKNKIQNQTIRNESVEKIFETNITKNNNNIPTQSSILSKPQKLKIDIDEKISIAKKDPTTFKNINNRKMPIMHHSSKEFPHHLAKGPININPQSYTKIITTTVDGKLKTIIQCTSLVIFRKINTTSPTTSTIKNISTPSIQVSTKNQNLEQESLIFEISSSNKSETN